MVNVVIPMAGLGKRFQAAGFELPKPLIDCNGLPIIKRVMEPIIERLPDAKFIFIVNEDHCNRWPVEATVRSACAEASIIKVPKVPMGPAASVLCAKDYIYNDEPLYIINCDNIIEWDQAALAEMLVPGQDGVVITFRSTDPRYSFVKSAPDGCIIDAVEKCVISEDASAGAYIWARGKDFVHSAELVIRRKDTVQGEYYVMQAIRHGLSLGLNFKSLRATKFIDLGTPADLAVATGEAPATEITYGLSSNAPLVMRHRPRPLLVAVISVSPWVDPVSFQLVNGRDCLVTHFPVHLPDVNNLKARAAALFNAGELKKRFEIAHNVIFDHVYWSITDVRFEEVQKVKFAPLADIYVRSLNTILANDTTKKPLVDWSTFNMNAIGFNLVSDYNLFLEFADGTYYMKPLLDHPRLLDVMFNYYCKMLGMRVAKSA